MKLKIKVQDGDSSLILICAGEIIQGPESEYLFDLVTQHKSELVIVDLASVEKIDEDGLVTLLLCHRILSSADTKLVLQNASPCVLQAIKQKRLDHFFRMRLSGHVQSQPAEQGSRSAASFL